MLGKTDAKRTEKTSVEGNSAYREKMKNKFNIQGSKISNHNTHTGYNQEKGHNRKVSSRRCIT